MSLFVDGPKDSGAEVLYAFDDLDGEADPRPLRMFASDLFDLKGTIPTDPEEKRTAEFLTDEYERVFGMKIPRSFAAERDYRHSSIMIHRPHLPHRVLRHTMFPVLVSPDGNGMVTIVPHRFWPQEYLQLWGPAD